MEKYFSSVGHPPSQNSNSPNVELSSNPNPEPPSNLKLPNCQIEINELPADPGLRKSIHEYGVNDIENVRRSYLQKGPCQPRLHTFPFSLYGTQKRRFVPSWFKDYSGWLEYSVSKDATFCLPCYLFKSVNGNQGGDSFVAEGFRNWKKKDRFIRHIGDHNSDHNTCVRACEDLMNQKQHIEISLSKQSDQSRMDYRLRLTASVDCIRFLLLQGLAFRGHDESFESANQGNFIEILEFLASHNDEIKRVVLGNAPGNLKLISPSVQKDIINAIAVETTNAIITDLGDDRFTILVDEARDISVKEQMAVVLRFVDTRGYVLERFLGIVHVSDTNALSLKNSIEALFSKHGLSISSLRGQGYDGASNMRGEFNGLKSLILMENQSAYYVHCFAHQLQLALVNVAESHPKIKKFFEVISTLTNIVSASCKRKDMLREKSHEKVIEGLLGGEILSGRGQNQEVSLGRAGATRWGSHYRTLMSLICLFDSTIEVLMAVGNDSKIATQRAQADYLTESIQCFEFVFCLFLMKNILGVSNDLSQALQRKDQDIVNAIDLVKITKEAFQNMRDVGWESLWEQVASFCIKRGIIIPSENDLYVTQGRSRRNIEKTTIMHYYHFELLNNVIDLQLLELNSRFDEVNTELLLCMSCLNPNNAFSAFDKRKLLRLAEFYPEDFSSIDIMALEHQLDSYIIDMRSHNEFVNLKGISELSKKLVQLKKDRAYPLVYCLLKLALILPVATATVERVFSAMKLVKTSLRNRLGDDVMNDCLIAYIEKDVVRCIETEDIIVRFQNMANRRMLL